MGALKSEVANPVGKAVEALIPEREDSHPLGCHSPLIPDKVCFEGFWSGW